MADKFVFTVTTGRSGTVYLTELLQQNLVDVTVYHERTGYLNFGVHTPDASHFTTFNSIGNAANVRTFWQQKFERDLTTPTEYYVETSHFLAKAGLLENLDILEQQAADIYIIILKRDMFDILWSYTNRFDFANLGFTWLFTLDYRYPNKIVNPAPLVPYHAPGYALWYIFEMFARAEYYKLLFKDNKKVHLIDVELKDIIHDEGAKNFLDNFITLDTVKLPGKKNESKNFFFDDKYKQQLKQLVDKFNFDPKALAKEFYDSGKRLATPSV